MLEFLKWLAAGAPILPEGAADLMIAPWLAFMLASAAVKGIGEYTKKKGEEKQAKEQNRAAVAQEAAKEEAARRAWDSQEQMRIARLRGLMELAATRGINIPVDPGMLQPRPFPGLGAAGAAGQADPGKGAGLGALGGALSGIGAAGQAGVAAGQRRQEDESRQAALRRFMCSIGIKSECDSPIGGLGGRPFNPSAIPGLGMPLGQ